MVISTTAPSLDVCSKNLLNKIETIQKRAFNLKLYWKSVINCTMEVRRLRTLALETFKTLHGLNPAFIKNLFSKSEVSNKRKNNLEIPNRKTVKYRDKIVRSLGPHMWNGLPEEIKNGNSYDKFNKEYFNT